MFDAIEQRVNAATMNRLANATATIGGSSIKGIFSNGSLPAGIGSAGFDAREPQIVFLDSDIAAVSLTGSISIEYQSVTTVYKMASKEPDGTGMTTVVLKK